MKTAISLPDAVFAAAERVAKKLRMSRSELYSAAIAEFVAVHDEAEITAGLDKVYEQEPAKVDPELARMQMTSLPRENW
jgi:predicted transcriptional regulator